jgi:hypothetical protein
MEPVTFCFGRFRQSFVLFLLLLVAFCITHFLLPFLFLAKYYNRFLLNLMMKTQMIMHQRTLMQKMTIYPKKGQMMLNQRLFQKKHPPVLMIK